MIRYLYVILLLPLLLAGCTTTSEPEVSQEDLERASSLNAELGMRYMQQGYYERAMGKLDKAIEQDSNNALAYHYKGELYRRVGKPEDAKKDFEKALDITPDEPSLLNNYAILLCDMKKYDEANRYFEKALNNPVYPDKAAIYSNMAQCSENQNNLKLTEEYYLKALRLDPNLPSANLGMAEIAFDMGLYDQSRQYLERFLAQRKHNSQSLWVAILLERRAGNSNRVASYAILLKGRFPDSEETRKLRQLESQGRL